MLHFRFAGAAAHSAAKPTTPVKGKAVRGAQRTPIKAVSKSQAGGVAKAPPKDPKLEQAKKKGLDKARETMRVKSTVKRTESSAGTWAQRNDDLDRTFVLEWLDGKAGYYGFVAGIIRLGAGGAPGSIPSGAAATTALRRFAPPPQ